MEMTIVHEKGALVPLLERELTPSIWNMIGSMAPVMWKSRLFGVASVEAATAIMLKGYEMGMSMTASFEFIQVIDSKPTLSPRGALALLMRSKDLDKLIIQPLKDDQGKYFGHSCYMKRQNIEYTAQFTMDDAKRAGLIRPNSAWEKYPENMCMWRAVGFCADVVAPDILSGMTTFLKAPENFEENVVEGFIEQDTQYTAPIPVNNGPKVSLTDLCNQYGAEAVMIANEGKIPGTDEEVFAVASKLGGG